jgi:rSAM/selenodomain-associated transferase 1
MKDERVLAIMAKAPRAGHVKTRLSRNAADHTILELYRCLVEDTVAMAQSLPSLHVAIVCPPGDGADLRAWRAGVSVVDQTRPGLAAALTMTFDYFAAAGFARIIALNADTPHLPNYVLEQAFDALGTHEIVVGPTDDGGYYLVGARSPHPTLFEAAPLSTGDALAALLSRAHAFGLTCARTDACYDIDVNDDLEHLALDLAAAPHRAPRTAAYLAKRQYLRDSSGDSG